MSGGNSEGKLGDTFLPAIAGILFGMCFALGAIIKLLREILEALQ